MSIHPHLIHPARITIHYIQYKKQSAPVPFSCIGQVKWDQHEQSHLHKHLHMSHYDGSITLLAKQIKPPMTEKQLLGAQIITIAQRDYTDAMLFIQHVLPLGHHVKPMLIKAFFSAMNVPIK